MTGAGGEMERQVQRAIRFLTVGEAVARPASKEGTILLDGSERGVIAIAAEAVAGMPAARLLTLDGDVVRLTDAGPRAGDPDGQRFQDQHRDLDRREIQLPYGSQIATVNLAESPLGQLFRRKDRNGKPFIDERELRAGERLRSDYTRGQIMPRLGANWVASVSSGKRGGGVADLTDAALAARIRVEAAITAVGPELNGILLDVCCFLKGLEQVEMERGWPVRSAKIVLKTALGALARHYDPRAAARKDGVGMLHWGASDFRPSLAG